MHTTSNNTIKKHSKDIKKINKIVIEELSKDCQALLYYKDGILRKSKVFQLPHIPKLKKQVVKQINREYHLWIKVLWSEGYLEEDDIQLINFIDKKEKVC